MDTSAPSGRAALSASARCRAWGSPAAKRAASISREPGELLQKRHQRRQVADVGAFVHAVERGKGALLQVARHRLVRKDHGLFHQRGRVGLAPKVDGHGPPLGVEAHLGLGGVEVEAARRRAHGRAPLRKAGERREAAGDRAGSRAGGSRAARGGCWRGGAPAPFAAVRPFRTRALPRRPGASGSRAVGGGGGAGAGSGLQQALRLVVGQARVRADEGGVDLVARQFSRVVQIQIHRHGAARLAGLERAQLPRQLVRQHGDHAVHQIHARPAPPCVAVERAVPRHVVRHVRNVHPQPPHAAAAEILRLRGFAAPLGMTGELFPRSALVHPQVVRSIGGSVVRQNDGIQRKRVVEVARVGGVDGEREAAAQVAVAGRKRALLIEHGGARLGEGVFGKGGFQPVARNDHLHARACVVGAPHHFLHHAGGRRVARGIGLYAHPHERAVLYVGPVGAAGEDVVGDARVFGHYHAERFGHLVAPNQRVARPLHHAHDARCGPLPGRGGRPAGRAPAAGAAAAFLRQGRQLHHVAVEGAAHLGGRHEELPFGSLHEPVSPAVHRQHAARVRAGGTPRVRARTGHGGYPCTSDSAVSKARRFWASLAALPAATVLSGSTPTPSMSWPRGLL